MQINKLLPWFLILCIVFLIISIISNIYAMVKAQNRLLDAEQKVVSLEKEQQHLIEEKTQQTSQNYLEGQIRNNLKLVMPGETLVVIPSQLKQLDEETVYKYTPKDKQENSTQRPLDEWVALIL